MIYMNLYFRLLMHQRRPLVGKRALYGRFYILTKTPMCYSEHIRMATSGILHEAFGLLAPPSGPNRSGYRPYLHASKTRHRTLQQPQAVRNLRHLHVQSAIDGRSSDQYDRLDLSRALRWR